MSGRASERAREQLMDEAAAAHAGYLTSVVGRLPVNCGQIPTPLQVSVGSPVLLIWVQYAASTSWGGASIPTEPMGTLTCGHGVEGHGSQRAPRDRGGGGGGVGACGEWACGVLLRDIRLVKMYVASVLFCAPVSLLPLAGFTCLDELLDREDGRVDRFLDLLLQGAAHRARQLVFSQDADCRWGDSCQVPPSRLQGWRGAGKVFRCQAHHEGVRGPEGIPME